MVNTPASTASFGRISNFVKHVKKMLYRLDHTRSFANTLELLLAQVSPGKAPGSNVKTFMKMLLGEVSPDKRSLHLVSIDSVALFVTGSVCKADTSLEWRGLRFVHMPTS